MISSGIKWKIWLVVGILLLSIIVNTVAWQLVARKNSVSLELIANVLIPASQKSQELVGEFKTQYRHYQDSVMFGDLGLLAQAQNVRQRIEKICNDLIAEYRMPEKNRRLIEVTYDEYIQYCIAADYVYSMMANNESEKIKEAQELTPDLDRQKEYLMRKIQDLADLMSQDLLNKLAAVNSNTRQVNLSVMVFSIFIVVVAFGVNIFIVKVKIHRPIDAIINQLNTEKKGKELESQLYERHRLESLGELAGGVAHEINNPIACVQNNILNMASYVEMLKEIISLATQIVNGDKDQAGELLGRLKGLDEREDFNFVLNDISRLLKESEDASRKISSIVANMLLFARPDASDTVRFNVIDGLKSALRIMQSEITEICRLFEDYYVVSDIIGYPGDINLAFLSILNNALQAIHEDGSIWIKVWEDSGRICISIRDDGCGMSSDDMKCIFDPFYSTRPLGKGLGLGLSVAHTVVSKHDGRIEVVSEVGKGSTFTIILPVVSRLSREFGKCYQSRMEALHD